MKKHLKKIYCFLLLSFAPVVEFVASAQDAKSFLDTATNQVTGAAQAAIDFVSAIIGLVEVFMLGWNFYKRAKGDTQSQDSLVNWGSALIFSVILLQIIKATLLK